MTRAKNILWAIILVVSLPCASPVTAHEDHEENPWAGIEKAVDEALDTAVDIGAETITGAAGEIAKEAAADRGELPPGYMDGMKDITRGMLGLQPGKSSQALETGIERITGSIVDELGELWRGHVNRCAGKIHRIQVELSPITRAWQDTLITITLCQPIIR